MFTLPARIAAIAYQNKAVVYNRYCCKASSQTMRTIADDPKLTSAPRSASPRCAPHLGLRDDPSSTRPHDRAGWWDIARRHPLGRLHRPNFLLPVKVLSRLFRRLMLMPDAARRTRDRPLAVLRRPRPTRLQSRVQGLSRAAASDQSGSSIAKGHSPDPSRYSPICPATPTGSRISSSRLIAANATGVTFSYKDYPDRGTRPLQRA